jgi:NADPH-dependent glutamate synthase beta subunit-like oxidoreductase
MCWVSVERIAPCENACPIHMNVPEYIMAIAQDRFEDAYRLIRLTNPLPAVCGRVCYHPCEDVCTRHYVDDPLAINALKRFATEAIDSDKVKVPHVAEGDRRVVIIGSGPAGLAAAHDLASFSYDVTVLEAMPQAGGMLRAGIPEYRLPKPVLDRDIKYIEKLGVSIKTNTRVGTDVKIEDMQRNYHAIFIATGAHNSLKLGVPGEELEGVVNCVDFLRGVNEGRKASIGKRVIVIGGGNVAIDVARSAIRLGAEAVRMVCLESEEQMPAFRGEVEEAMAEGVTIQCSRGPKSIVGNNGRVAGVECIACTAVFDAAGRFSPTFCEDEVSVIEGDTVILAIGLVPNLDFAKATGLELSGQGLLVANEASLATGVAGIFAGGDAVKYPGTTVEAMAAGKRAARSIDRYLMGLDLEQPGLAGRVLEVDEGRIPEVLERRQRRKQPALAASQRVGSFKEVEQGFSQAEAVEEAKRCLYCSMCGNCIFLRDQMCHQTAGRLL